MRTLLENTYGFDAERYAPGIPGKSNKSSYGDPYLGFLPDSLIEAVGAIFRVPKRHLIDHAETMRGGDGSHHRVARPDGLYDGIEPIRYHDNPHFVTSSTLFQQNFTLLRQTAARQVLRLWHGVEDGYQYADFEQFLHRVVAQINHIEQSWKGVRETVSDQYFLLLYEGMFGYSNYSGYSSVGMVPKTWRYAALRLMEIPDTAIMGPNTGTPVDYGDLAPTMEAVMERGLLATKFIQCDYDFDHHAAYATLRDFFSTPGFDRDSGEPNSPRDTGLLRHIEMNEFLHHGAADQTLADFLGNTSWLEDRVRELRIHDYGETTAVLDQDKEHYKHLPYFMRFYDTRNMPLGVQKMVLDLTRDQWYELYKNPAKRPSALRTDAKSRSKKFVEAYLAAFFDDGEHLEDYGTLDPQQCQELLMETVLHGDMQTYFAARTVESPAHGIVTRQGIPNTVYDMLTTFFQEVYRGGNIFMRQDRVALFHLLHQQGGFQGQSMAARMIFAYCLDMPGLFSYDTGEAENQVTVLGNAVLAKDISAQSAVQFIVDAGSHDMECVPVVNGAAIDVIKQHTGKTPVAWYMGLLTMKERQNVLPKTFFKLAQIEGSK